MSPPPLRHYELLLITQTEFSESGDNFVELIKNNGGTVTRHENWGRQLLAYPINKHKFGCYVLINFSTAATGELIAKLEDALTNNDPILRGLITKTDRVITGGSPYQLAKEAKLAAEAA